MLYLKCRSAPVVDFDKLQLIEIKANLLADQLIILGQDSPDLWQFAAIKFTVAVTNTPALAKIYGSLLAKGCWAMGISSWEAQRLIIGVTHHIPELHNVFIAEMQSRWDVCLNATNVDVYRVVDNLCRYSADPNISIRRNFTAQEISDVKKLHNAGFFNQHWGPNASTLAENFLKHYEWEGQALSTVKFYTVSLLGFMSLLGIWFFKQLE